MDAIFVGREAELVDLDALVRRAATQAPAVALVEAPAGVGKSAVLDRFIARTTDALVVRVSGDESEAAIAFGVYDQLLARLPADVPSGRGPTDSRCSSNSCGKKRRTCSVWIRRASASTRRSRAWGSTRSWALSCATASSPRSA